MVAEYNNRILEFKKLFPDFHKDDVKKGETDLKELLSGNISKNTLRRAGHPFGRKIYSSKSGIRTRMRGTAKRYTKKYGRSNFPKLPINKQSGKAYRGVTTKRINDTNTILYSKSKSFQYVGRPEGTLKMIPRGLFAELRKRHIKRQKERIKKAREVILKGFGVK